MKNALSKLRTATYATYIAVSIIGVSSAHAQSDFTSFLIKTSAGTFEIEGAEKIVADRAKEMMEAGTLFVDVRRESQFGLGHIPGAVSLELKSKFTEQNLAEVAQKDEAVIFYCSDAKCYRSAHASAMAVSWGYEHVGYFAEGWSIWTSYGYPRD